MRYYEIINKSINEARMGSKELSSVNGEGFTFGFELEIIVPDDKLSNIPFDEWIKTIDVGKIISRWVDIKNVKKEYQVNFDDIMKNEKIKDFYEKYKKYNDSIDIELLLSDEETEMPTLDVDIKSLEPELIKVFGSSYDNDLNVIYNILSGIKYYPDNFMKFDGIIVKRNTDLFKTFDDIELYLDDSDIIKDLIDDNIKTVYENIANNIDFDTVKNIIQHEVLDKVIDITGISSGWKIVKDGSIGDSGGEIVSPPIKGMNKALNVLKALFDNLGNFITNKKTGLHINIGTFDINDIDLLKLILFSGQQYVAGKFGRENNSYTRMNITQINHMLIDNDKTDYNKFVDTINKEILSTADKMSFFNFKHLISGEKYIEIRGLGNENYQFRYNEIENMIKRFVRNISIAMDPNAYREEYLKKLKKAIDFAPINYSDDSFNLINNMFEKRYGISDVKLNSIYTTEFMEKLSTILYDNNISVEKITPDIKKMINTIYHKMRPNKKNVNYVHNNIINDLMKIVS